MTWLLSLLHALLGAVAGFFGFFGIASQWVRWFRVSSAQGSAGYYVFYLAIMGAVLGGIVGLVASRFAVDGSNSNFVRGLGYVATAIAAGLALVYTVSWMVADHPPKIDGRRLVVEVEIRTPPVTALLERSGYEPGVSLFDKQRKARGFNTDYGSSVRSEGNRRVVTTRVELGSSQSARLLYVRWSEGCHLQIVLALPRKPTKAHFEWSQWQDVAAFSPSDGWEAPGVDLKFAARYRVQFEPMRPTPPTEAERAAQESAQAVRFEQQQRALLAAVPSGAPISQYLAFTRYELPKALKTAAFARMRESEHFAQEYRAAVLHANSDTAVAWMEFAVEFPGERAPVIEAIRLAGEDLSHRIEKLTPTATQQVDSTDATYDVLARFGGFFNASFTLREARAGDFAPELRAILKVARTKQNTPGIRSDIVRVASYYLQQWAGDAPLPNDPPPK